MGDLLQFSPGTVLPADGLLVCRLLFDIVFLLSCTGKVRGADVACDESALTGESDELKKDPVESPFMLSGTAVMKGTGLMLVTCVGLFSEEGIIQKLITGVGEEEVRNV